MIQELLEYARTRGLDAEEGFRPKAVRWLIQLGADGSYRGIVELGDSGQKGNRGLLIDKAPDLQQGELIAGGEIRSHFIIDTVPVVTLLDNTNAKEALKHRYFVELLRDASAEVPELVPVVAFFQNAKMDVLWDDLRQLRIAPGDKITIAVDGQIIAAGTSWHVWWRNHYQALRAGKRGGVQVANLATGHKDEVATTHLKVSGLVNVGGAATGDALVSFDKPAFESYGLKQGYNAPMSPQTVASYRAALDQLIQRGETLGKVRMIYWYRHAIADEDDWVKKLFDGDDEELEGEEAEHHAKQMLKSIRQGGKSANIAPQNTFYALLLSGVSGRVMVRGWYQEDFETIHRNVTNWVDDLSVSWQGRKYGSPPLWKLLRDLGRPDVPSPLIRVLWESAVFGRAIPRQAVQRALARIKSNIVRGDSVPRGVYGILQAFIRRDESEGGSRLALQDVGNLHRSSTAYQCGRLLALLAAIQWKASGDVNASVINRFYSSASTNPMLAFPQLLRLSNHHLAKIDPNIRQWFTKQIAEILANVPEFPHQLGLKDQSLFALGYFHQLGTKTERRETDVATDH